MCESESFDGWTFDGLDCRIERLLPGFVAAWIFYGLTGHSKPSPFERVVQALVYNVIVQPFVIAIGFLMLLIGHVYSFGDWTVSS